jgi:hypothetical protein
MATEHGNQEFLIRLLQPDAKEQVLGALGGLMADGVVEVVFDPQQPEQRYNPDVVIDRRTGQPIAFITPEMFQRAAAELGMGKAQGTRVHSLIARHFSREGIKIDYPLLTVPADLFPGLMNDLRQGHTNIKHLRGKSMGLLEHLLGKLHLPEEQIE